jgi:tetratricopeptide (TPR) repeat protein
MRSLRSVGAGLLLLALAPWPVHAFNFTPTDAEWATWPEMCKARYATTRIGSGSTFGSQVQPATIELWQAQLGGGWNYVHHHCAGMIYLDRARLEGSPSQRKFLLNRSLSEHRFALEHTPPGDPFAAEIRTRIGLTLREAKQYPEALQSLDAAIAVNQRYGEAYVAKALVQRDQNKTRECLATLRAGDEATGGQSLEINHFLAVVLMQQQQFEEAREHARRAYALGYPMPGLRDKLKAAGYPL